MQLQHPGVVPIKDSLKEIITKNFFLLNNLILIISCKMRSFDALPFNSSPLKIEFKSLYR